MSDDEGNDTIRYGNTKRAFLQALLSRQTITYEQAKPLIAAIETAANPNRPTLSEDVTEADFEEYVHSINTRTSDFDYEIRSSKHQVSVVRVYAFVNAVDDLTTQMATRHTPDEIAFVKRVLDAMFDTYNTQRAEVLAITSMQAVKLAKPSAEEKEAGTAALTMTQAEKMMESLVEQEWLEKSRRGYYSPTQRLIMELSTWLLAAYNEDEEDVEDGEEPHVRIKRCQGCRDIVTVGQRCPNLPCNVRLHDHCAGGFFRGQRGRKECPECKSAWEDPPLVGEMAAKELNGRRSTNGTSRRRSTAMSDDASGGAESD